MSQHAQLGVFCDDCDYKGTVRVPDGLGITHRRPCTNCGGKKIVRLQMTFGQLQGVVEENRRLRQTIEALTPNAEPPAVVTDADETQIVEAATAGGEQES